MMRCEGQDCRGGAADRRGPEKKEPESQRRKDGELPPKRLRLEHARIARLPHLDVPPNPISRLDPPPGRLKLPIVQPVGRRRGHLERSTRALKPLCQVGGRVRGTGRELVRGVGS